MKQYTIHFETGDVKSFFASNDEEAEDILFEDKTLPKNIQLDLNHWDGDKWNHITSMLRISSDKN